MTLALVLGYAAAALNVAGNTLLVYKNAFGWVLRLVVNALNVAYAVQIAEGGPILVNHLAFAVINIVGFVRWRRDAQAT